METWLYQISQELWSPQRYRTDIWEGERWAWPVGRKVSGAKTPEPGDTVFFFYAKSKGTDPGFYGWAVVLEWRSGSKTQLHFRPTAPSDFLKMHPWSSKRAFLLANLIRGKVKQGTLWLVPEKTAKRLRLGLARWLPGAST